MLPLLLPPWWRSSTPSQSLTFTLTLAQSLFLKLFTTGSVFSPILHCSVLHSAHSVSQEDWLVHTEGANHCRPSWLFTLVYLASISSCSALDSFWDLSSFANFSRPTDTPSETLPAFTEIISRAFLPCTAAPFPDILPLPFTVALKHLYLHRSPA